MTPETVPRVHDSVRIRRVGGRLLVAATAATLELSDTAEFVFRNIDGVRSLGALSAMVADHYDIPGDVARQDTTELLDDLVAQRILTWG